MSCDGTSPGDASNSVAPRSLCEPFEKTNPERECSDELGALTLNSPAPYDAAAGDRRSASVVCEPQDSERSKRYKTSASVPAMRLDDSIMMPPPQALPEPQAREPLRSPLPTRQNSIMDNKMLYCSDNMRAGSLLSGAITDFEQHFKQHFEWGPQLGSGSFADVYMVRSRERPDELKAVKVSKTEFHSKRARSDYLREVRLSESMERHVNIVFYDMAWQANRQFFILMEYCDVSSPPPLSMLQPDQRLPNLPRAAPHTA